MSDKITEARRAKFEAWCPYRTDRNEGVYISAIWLAWNAALDSVVVELPRNDLSMQGEDRWKAKQIAINACRAAIHAAGVRTK